MADMGVIGIGSMGRNHARVYSEIANLRGVADIDKKIVNEVSRKFHTEGFTDYRELFSLDLDGVSIAVPTEMHFKVAMDAIEHGLNVLLEKPITRTIKEGEELIKAAEREGVVLAVGHIERHNPVVRYTKKGIEEGNFGDIITITSKRVSSFPTRIRDVGVIMDLAIHDIDVMRYLVNAEVESVYTIGGGHDGGRFETFANILIGFEGGVSGVVEANWLTPMKVRKLWITCSSDYVELDYITQTIRISTSKLLDFDVMDLYHVPWEYNIRDISLRKEEPLKNELRDFINAIMQGKEPLITGQDALLNLKVAKAATHSYRQGKKVILSDFRE